MPNGKPGDNPLTDLVTHGHHPFPPDVETLLLEIEALGRQQERWPLGENWPFSPREGEWEQGNDLEGARNDLAHLLAEMKAGRGDYILIDPGTGRPLAG